MGLEDFLNLWKGYEELKKDSETHKANNADLGVYRNTVRRYVERNNLGDQVDNAGNPVDPATGQGIRFSPIETSGLVESQKAYSQITAHQYAQANLEGILGEVPEDRLQKLLIYNLPKQTGDESHDKIARNHLEYLILQRPLNDLKDEKNEKKAIGAVMQNAGYALQEIYKEKYGEDILEKIKNNSPLGLIFESAALLASTNPQIAALYCKKAADIKYKQLKGKLAGKTAQYVMENLSHSEAGEREEFYSNLYNEMREE